MTSRLAMGYSTLRFPAPTEERTTMSEASEYDEAARTIKKRAAEQKIHLEVSDEQARALLDQWRGGNPEAPAEIRIVVAGQERINLKVAGYWYAGDTCCA